MSSTNRAPRELSAKMSSHAAVAALRGLLLAFGLVAGCGGADAIAEVDSAGGSSTGSTAAGSTGATSGMAAETTTDAVTTGGSAGDGSSGSTGVAEPGEGSTGSTGGGDASSTGDAGDSTGDGGASSGGEETPAVSPKIKVMTFNIRVGTAADGENAWANRKGLVYDVFEIQDADFVGVQEALNFQLEAIDANVAGYKRIGVSTVDGGNEGAHNAIYYRKSRFTVAESNTFWLSDTPNKPGSQTWGNKFPRAVTWGRFVEKDTGYSLYVYNTHFDHVSQNSREKSAVLLAQRIAARAEGDDPFVVTGDFNAAEGNLAVRFLKGNAKIDGATNEVPMRDTFRVVHPTADDVGTAHGFNGGTGGNKIDYVFVPPKQKVVGASIIHYNVDGRYPSDHFPVVATVRFAAQSP